jgi:hypothetical protein
MVMVALAILVLALLIWTNRQAAGLAHGESVSRTTGRQPASKGIASLMMVAAVTLLGASAIHFGLTMPFVNDPFGAAVIPEAVLGVVLGIGSVVLVSGRPGSWEIAVASAVLTTLLTLFGFSITLRGGRVGDIAYHITLLLMLFASIGLLLSPLGRRALSCEL